MGAMTMSPVKGQNKHIRHGEDMASVKHHTNSALRRIVTRIQRNFRKRRANAHKELAQGCVFSNAWTSDFLIRKGQALLDRNHANRIFLKSARLSPTLFIAWNFDVGDWLEVPHPLYHVIPFMLRVTEIRLCPSVESNGSDFVKCDCGQREGMGSPCECFFKHCWDAGLADQEMIDPCMMDVRYWKIYHTNYPGICDGQPQSDNSLAELILQAQAESFTNKGRGICVPRKVMEALLKESPGTE